MSTLNEHLTNYAARFEPADDQAPPAIRLGMPDDADGDSVLVFAYWSDGELVVTVDTEDAPGETVPVRFAVNNDRHAYTTVVRP